jgi:hypothetical protein
VRLSNAHTTHAFATLELTHARRMPRSALRGTSPTLYRPRKYSSKQTSREDILGSAFYRVRHSNLTIYADESAVCAKTRRADDFGMPSNLEDTSTAHVACARWCSCLFSTHWGIPCRHMVAIWHREGARTIPDGVVHHRWLLEDNDEELRRLYAHRVRALPRRSSHAPGTTMSPGERAAELTTLGKLIADAASTLAPLHAAAKIRLDDILTAIKNCTLTAGDTRGAREQMEAGGSGAAASNPTPLVAARNPAKKTTELGGHRAKGVQERAQDAARKASATAAGKRPAAAPTDAQGKRTKQ